MGRIEAGSQIGRFSILRHLGGGATGSVFLAHDTRDGIRVALKILQPLEVAEREARQRFERELSLAMRVTHPGICRPFSLHEEQGHTFLVMEYIDGPTLEDVLQREGVIEVPDATRIARSIARSLHAAHKAEIIHRDLKPANVALAAGRRPVILDFGFAIAQDQTRLTRPGVAMGTLNYIAPEIIEGADASPATDIYSLGVLCYRMVTGREPYEATAVGELLRQRRAGAPIPAQSLNPKIPGTLAAMIDACLSEPGTRPDSAAHVAGMLGSEQSGALERDTGSVSSWSLNLDDTVNSVIADGTASTVIRSKIETRAVLFTDIVGITRYFESHGDVRGRRYLQAHDAVVQPIIPDNNGALVKTIGDATLSIFPTTEQACSCAVEMMEALDSHNRWAEPDQQIFVRAGIHTGETIVESNDVFGRSVNMAARVCSEAHSGEILLSESSVTPEIRGRWETTSRGHFDLKGIEGSVALTRVVWSDDNVEAPVAGRLTEVHDITGSAPAVGRAQALVVEPVSRPLLPRILGSIALLAVGATLGWIGRGRLDEPAPRGLAQAQEVVPSIPSIAPPVTQPDLGSAALVPEPPAPREARPPPAEKDTAKRAFPADRRSRKALKTKEAARRAEETASVRGTIDRARQRIRQRGFIGGDLPDVEVSLTLAEGKMKQGDFEGATRLASKAVQEVEQFRISDAFISAKLARFNGRFDRLKSQRTKDRLQPVIGEIVSEIQAGRLTRANKRLNEASALMEGSR